MRTKSATEYLIQRITLCFLIIILELSYKILSILPWKLPPAIGVEKVYEMTLIPTNNFQLRSRNVISTVSTPLRFTLFRVRHGQLSPLPLFFPSLSSPLFDRAIGIISTITTLFFIFLHIHIYIHFCNFWNSIPIYNVIFLFFRTT